MGFENFLLEFFVGNVIIFSPIAGFLSEDILLFLFVVASVNGVGFFYILLSGLLGFLGIFVHDSLLYYLTNHNLIIKLSNKFNLSKSSFISFLNRFSETHYFIPLVFSKFIYGLRTAAVILVSKREKKFKTFLIYNTLANSIWLFIMLPIGYFTGKGFSFLFDVAKNLEHILAIAFVIAVIIYFVGKIFKRKVRKYEIVNS